jgi:hypothetical protein
MRLSDTAWTAHDHGVRQRTVSDCTRGDSMVTEFFTNEAEAWDAVAEINRRDAEHKELGAREARQREREAHEKAQKLRNALAASVEEPRT